MAKKTVIGFDALIYLTGKFVEQQKGVWGHTEWLSFLKDVQKKGFELSDDIINYLGSVLDAMKNVYESTVAAKGARNVMSGIATETINFIKTTKGVWGHSEWESFLRSIQKTGINLTDESLAYLGGVLESVNKIYATLPPLVSKEGSKMTSKKEVKRAKPAK